MNNYTNTIEVKTTASKAYNALAYHIPLWWTEMFEGASEKTGDIFTIRFGADIYKTMQVKEAISDTKMIWNVEDSLIALPELKNQTEWIGTTIVWEIEETEENSRIKVTHLGLNPDIECYDICSNGWIQFLGSLKLFLETGNGTPYKK
ncbi:SRPBCC family protein [Chryseobacterium jejuense]|uniref:Activator of Hsp90 ATPase homolog 1-like protein n=1 Tax=Chryseobacterium jejuense TaxID=445960 RepID=A0A2X2X7I2_CHRJE|nr:SRPBCC domain-containing protein [Chryseobacterium jejuense]SDI19726.1 Activator of Hsp90 ATPase homolog 1-like protein [Chryseobacterium jejuense]SQB46661.1 Uncharacterised protein [Chryseobacterium jejuense]